MKEMKSQSPHTSRRAFLGAATAAAAAPAIIPSSVLGAQAPSNQLTFAALGVGNRGAGISKGYFAGLKDVRVVAAADCWKSRRERFAAEIDEMEGGRVCTPYADYREVLARDDIDGVIIGTPDHWHVPLAILAAQAGKHMYVEKPLGTSMKLAWRLRDEIRRSGVKFLYGTQQRSQPHFRRACELVLNGYIGEITRVEAWSPDMSTQYGVPHNPPYGSTMEAPVPDDLNYDMWLGPAPMKPYTVDRCVRGGQWHIYDYALGFIAGWGAHPLDIAQWGLQRDHTSPVRYEGTGHQPPRGALWDTTESWDMTCTYAGGLPMRFMDCRVAKPLVREYHYTFRNHGTTFHGTEGWISVDRNALYSSGRNQYTKIELKNGDTRLHASDHPGRDLVQAIRTGGETVCPIEAAIRSDTISHLTDIVARTGRSIEWDPEREKIIGDPEAEKFLDRPMRTPWTV
ncbi:Gfo/Idh/MocA family protein [Kiritimatiella glycovorans]|uniref:Putative oxidoreductase n=1 Tax=Kiritimatiella glycovorans TaxID=1307763 RepID=A0A0G3EFF0_9BACT|nr:Gfo/Idh/MocA family oxidoreductase [Kiritimatiella glycovorans]AKJ65068.1 putative oxidoreductase [Kiritimatiella glycovorans]